MATSVELQKARKVWEPPLATPLNEAVWRAWLAKGREQDRRGGVARVKAVELALIGVLLATAGLGPYVAPYEVVVRFIVAAGAFAVMLHAFHARHYAFAAVFGALALLYNPVAPFFGFSGDWQRTIVAASAVPFVASLALRKVRKEPND